MELNGVRDEEIWIFEVTRISFTERTERNISGNILSGSGYQVNGSKGEGEMWGPCVPPPFLLFFLMLLLFLSYLFSLVLLSLDRAERLPARQGAAAGRRARWWVAAHRLTDREAAWWWRHGDGKAAQWGIYTLCCDSAGESGNENVRHCCDCSCFFIHSSLYCCRRRLPCSAEEAERCQVPTVEIMNTP